MMTSTNPNIAFIGGGAMARSLIGGLIAHGWAPDTLHVGEPNAALREALTQDFGVHTYADNIDAVSHAELWVFAVKPQAMSAVCKYLASIAQSKHPLIVSIAAGITNAQLERWLGDGLSIVRTMPNTPALLGVGATGLFANMHTNIEQRALAERLLQATGLTVWLTDEKLMDTVTALSGSGPAYIFLMAEAMQAAAEAQGLPIETARALTLQTIFGAARMLIESKELPAELRRRVTSPGGTTQAALECFEAGGFHQLIAGAIAAATRRGGELSAAND